MPRRKKDIPEIPAENQENEPYYEPEEMAPEPVPETAIGPRRFVSNAYPHLCLGIKGQTYCFKNGDLVTDNIDVIRAIESHPWFKIHIHNG